VFQIAKPIAKIGMGFDNLPDELKNSSILNGSDLAVLASFEVIPAKQNEANNVMDLSEKHTLAKQLISQGKIDEAWQVLL
jgi:hypothetical protein